MRQFFTNLALNFSDGLGFAQHWRHRIQKNKSPTTHYQKLLQTHVVCHLHPNNARDLFRRKGVYLPQCVEMTWISRDRALKRE